MNQIYWTNLFNQPYKTESNQPILPSQIKRNQIYRKLMLSPILALADLGPVPPQLSTYTLSPFCNILSIIPYPLFPIPFPLTDIPHFLCGKYQVIIGLALVKFL